MIGPERNTSPGPVGSVRRRVPDRNGGEATLKEIAAGEPLEVARAGGLFVERLRVPERGGGVPVGKVVPRISMILIPSV
jgi:hypothetical protein